MRCFRKLFMPFLAIVVAAFGINNARAANIFFVGGQAEATQGDDAFVLEHLEDVLGHTVEYSSGDNSSTGDVDGMDLLVISSTLGSGSVRGKFQDEAIPILQWEEALIRWNHADPDGNFRMSESSRNGQTRETDTIRIVESAVGHPLAAGFPAGELVIFDDLNRTPQAFGEHAPGLIRIAELDPEFAEEDVSFWQDENGVEQSGPEFVLTAIDKGAELGPPGDGFIAPEKRVNFPIEDLGFSILNDNGIKLFNASIDWLLGTSDPGVPGDVDGDGDCDADDIDALSAAVNAGDMGSQFDVNGDGSVNADDRKFLICDIKGAYLGDSNLDGEFNSSDFVFVFQINEYEDNITGNSGWADGDWNGDGDFDSSDFVVAFQEGGYEIGPKVAPAGAAVPEPSSLILLLVGAFLIVRTTRSRK